MLHEFACRKISEMIESTVRSTVLDMKPKSLGKPQTNIKL